MSGPTAKLEQASDAALIDLLRGQASLGIADLATALGVTATAIRQRLDRLIRAGLVEKMSAGTAGDRSRGRPAHAYALTARGRQLGGDNFRDLAMVLWREIRGIPEPSVRQGLFSRIGGALAEMYRDAVRGDSALDRLEGVARLLRDREIPCSVDVVRSPLHGSPAPAGGGLPVLTSHACPFPELAEHDRGICAAERLMLEDLVGAPVKLSECRLDGDTCCRFTVQAVSGAGAGLAAEGLATNGHSASNPC